MHVRPSHAGETGAARASSPAASRAVAGTGGAVFEEMLAKASNPPTASAPAPVADAVAPAPAPAHEAGPIRLRAGETVTAVAGQAYVEIHGGARDGMFVNTSGNHRRGTAFTLVHRADGRELHIYGSGKDRLVVRVGRPHDPAHPPEPIHLRPGETMTPIPGHHYAQINGGERDGLMINTTRSKRRGTTFALVHKDGDVYHVYGSGRDRTVIKEVPYDWGRLVDPPAPLTVITRATKHSRPVTKVVGPPASPGEASPTATNVPAAAARASSAAVVAHALASVSPDFVDLLGDRRSPDERDES